MFEGLDERRRNVLITTGLALGSAAAGATVGFALGEIASDNTSRVDEVVACSSAIAGLAGGDEALVVKVAESGVPQECASFEFPSQISEVTADDGMGHTEVVSSNTTVTLPPAGVFKQTLIAAADRARGMNRGSGALSVGLFGGLMYMVLGGSKRLEATATPKTSSVESAPES